MSKKNIGTLDDILDSFLEVFDTLVDGLEESIEKIIEDSSGGEINVDEISEVVANSLSTMGITLKTGESIQAQDISTMINPLIDEVKKQFKKATSKFNINMKDIIAQVYEGIEEEK